MASVGMNDWNSISATQGRIGTARRVMVADMVGKCRSSVRGVEDATPWGISRTQRTFRHIYRTSDTHRQYKGVERPRNDFRGFTVGKSVQIPESLFFDLVRWFWAEQQTADREQRIKDELAKKVTAMSKRQQYMDFLFGDNNGSVTEPYKHVAKKDIYRKSVM